jgi:hypothetical protein
LLSFFAIVLAAGASTIMHVLADASGGGGCGGA